MFGEVTNVKLRNCMWDTVEWNLCFGSTNYIIHRYIDDKIGDMVYPLKDNNCPPNGHLQIY